MKMKTRDIVYIAVFVALAVVFEWVSKMIPFLQMPNGGSIELSVIAIICASFLLGWKSGLVVAYLSWLVSSLFFQPYYLNPMQMVFDYILPIGILGVASALAITKKGRPVIWSGVLAVLAIKTLSHVLAGALFWPPAGEAAGSMPAIVFSLSYNLPYNVATLLFAVILVPIILQRLGKKNAVQEKAISS